MKRWIVLLASAWLLMAIGCSRPPAKTSSEPARRAAWLQTEPLVIVGQLGQHADLPPQGRRQPVWQEEDYLREHTEETVRRLKDLGVTMAVIHFYKGFGLEAEKEHIEEARKLAALCKKYGMRVGVYVGSTIGYETFLVELPGAQAWLVPRLSWPARDLRRTDFPQARLLHAPRIPRVHEARTATGRRGFEGRSDPLRQHQPAGAAGDLPPSAGGGGFPRLSSRTSTRPRVLKKRLGFSDVRYVEPPEWDRPMRRHRRSAVPGVGRFPLPPTGRLLRGDGATTSAALNPEVAVECNPHCGISGPQHGLAAGHRLPPAAGAAWTWCGPRRATKPASTSDGILVSKIRTYKMAALLKQQRSSPTPAARATASWHMAEAMAYNRQNLGMVGGMAAGYQLPPDQRAYVKFYRDNFENYADVESRGRCRRAALLCLHGLTTTTCPGRAPCFSSRP